jgi:hypothetical protein
MIVVIRPRDARYDIIFIFHSSNPSRLVGNDGTFVSDENLASSIVDEEEEEEEPSDDDGCEGRDDESDEDEFIDIDID